MALPTTWIVGDWREPVFADAITWLNSHAACQCFDSLAAAIEKPGNAGDDKFPSSILWVQSRPGQIAARDIEQFHARHPLSRLVVITGPWCEGELRSGRPSPGVVRIPWRSWQDRLPLNLGLGDLAATLLPRTATETERVEWAVGAVRSAPRLHGTAAICTRGVVNYAYLADAIGHLGLTALSRSDADFMPHSAADVFIFDGWKNIVPVGEYGPQSNGRPKSSRVLLLHFPRPDDHTRAKQANIDDVLAQPLSLVELAASLSRLLQQPA